MPTRLRALIVEARDEDAALLVAELRKGPYELEHARASDEASFRAALRDPWDVILACWSLPGFDAGQSLAVAKELAPQVPFIVVSRAVHEGAIEAIRSGARDVIILDRIERLLPVVEREVRDARARAAERRTRVSAEELQASEERFRALFEHGPIPMWVFDPETRRFLEVNDAAVAQYGYTREEFLRMTLDDIRPPEELQRLREDFQQPFPVKGTTSLWKHRRKDGSLLDVQVTGHTLQEGSRPSRLVLAQDVTHRLRQERALQQRAVLADLTAAIGLALTRGDSLEDTLFRCATALVDRLSAGLARIWTVDRAGEALELQATAGELPPPADAGDVIPLASDGLVARIASSRRALATADLAAHLRDGAWLERHGPVAFAGCPIEVDGKLVGAMALFAAPEVGHVLPDALDAIADAVALGIQRKLVERARDEVEAQLRQSQRMEAIGSLAGGVAHDFNNLLSVIVSYSALLADALPDDHRARADLEEIGNAANRAAALTRQLLAFSRKQVLQPRVVDVNAVVQSMQAMLRRLIGENIELASSPSPEPAKVNVDPSQLEQVILNLAVNARDAMPTGGRLAVEVRIVELRDNYAAAHPGVTPGTWVMLAVSDTGVGMSREIQARIFEPFFTTKEVGKGTGLGLSTVFGIVRQSGGHVWVYSEEGHGSTFKVYLPYATADAVVTSAGAAPEPAALRGTETILLVEDEESVRRLARTVLERNGYTVLEAPSGPDALALGEARFDALLTDLIMPKMSGTQLAERLRKTRPGLPVVYMSGYTDDSVVAHGVLPSEVSFVQKPFTPGALLRKLREAFEVSRHEQRPRVLVVDDDPLILRLVPRALRTCEVVACGTALSALERVRRGETFDAVLCDVNLPGMSGPELERRLAEHDAGLASRMVFLTGGALDAGSARFLAERHERVLQKPAEVGAIRAAVAAAIERARQR